MVIDCLRFSLNGVSIKVTLIYKSLSLSIQITDTILCEWGSKTVWKYIGKSTHTSWAAMSSSMNWCFFSKFCTLAKSLPMSSDDNKASTYRATNKKNLHINIICTSPSQKSRSLTPVLNSCCWLASFSFWVFSLLLASSPSHWSLSASIRCLTSASLPAHCRLSISATRHNYNISEQCILLSYFGPC